MTEEANQNNYNPEIFFLPPIQKYNELMAVDSKMVKSTSNKNINNNMDSSFISFKQLKNQNNQKMYEKFPNLNQVQETVDQSQEKDMSQNDMTNRKNAFIQGIKYNKKQQQKIDENSKKQMMINYFQVQKSHFDNQKL